MVWCGERKGRLETSVAFPAICLLPNGSLWFPRLPAAKRRQNGGQPFGQHGFARTGRPNKDGIVAAGGCNLQGPLDAFLAFYIGKVGFKIVLRRKKFVARIHLYRLQRCFAAFKKLDDFFYVRNAIYRRLFTMPASRAFAAGTINPLKPSLRACMAMGRRLLSAAGFAIEAQFAHHQVLVKRLWFLNCSDAASTPTAIGRSKAVPLFFDIGRCQVHHNAGARHGVAVCFDGAFHALHAFLYGIVGQAYNQAVFAGSHPVYFHGDGDGFHTIHGTAKDFYKHVARFLLY
jgi:hypothetical protein